MLRQSLSYNSGIPGFGLLEVLVSIFILSLAVMGLDAMLLTAFREAKAGYYFRAAIQQIQNIATISSVADEIESQKITWNLQNKELLPNGRGVIEENFSYIKMHITWGDDSNSACQHHQISQTHGCLQYGPLQK